VTVALEPRVYIDGTDVAGITLTGARIEYGRNAPTEPDRPATAFLQLLTVDAVPQIADLFPAFGPGSFGAPSGYVFEYLDVWDGVSSRLTVGVDVRVTLESPSGYATEYGDEWGGITVPRFYGRVTALDYVPGTVNITAVDATERLGFVADSQTYPEETDTERAVRLGKLGGVDVTVTGSASVLLAGDPDPVTEAENPVIKPAVQQEITRQARWARATFVATPDGKVQYRTRDTPPNPYIFARAVGHNPHLGAVMTRYNLVRNPAFREGVGLWSGSPGFGEDYQAYSPTGYPDCAGWRGPDGPVTASTVCEYDIQAGVAYTLTLFTYTLTSSHTVETFIKWLDSSGAEILTESTRPTDTPDLVWQQSPPLTSIAPTGAASAVVGVTFDGRALTALLFNAVLFEPTPFPFPYFDGSFPNAEWLGTPNASVSEYESPPWPLPSPQVLEPNLGFVLDLGTVANTAEVDYVTTDAEGKQDTATVRKTDADSVKDYGERVERYSTRLALESDAAELAQASVDAYARPSWAVAAVTVLLTDADGREQLAAGTVTFGDRVQIGDLPTGAPEREITAEVIGWTDVLGSSGEWELTYKLARNASVTPGGKP